MKNNKKKRIFIIIVSIIAAIGIGLLIADSCIPFLTREEAIELVINELELQADEIEKKLGVSEITVELEITKFKYDRPSLFSKGTIYIEGQDYYVSNEFTDLENGIYNAETYDKYNKLPSLSCYHSTSDYYIEIHRKFSTSETEFKDSNGNAYDFFSDDIYKNGDYAYHTPDYDYSDDNSNSGYNGICNTCGGNGKTHDWNYGDGRRCVKCGGDGWIG